jgi:hypothetical protein
MGEMIAGAETDIEMDMGKDDELGEVKIGDGVQLTEKANEFVQVEVAEVEGAVEAI